LVRSALMPARPWRFLVVMRALDPRIHQTKESYISLHDGLPGQARQ
jgi:hypothetical protein